MNDSLIREAVQQLSGTSLTDKVQLWSGTVNSVNIPARTCDVTKISGKTSNDIPNVQLMAGVDDGILCVPTEGSTVFILQSDTNPPFICLFTELDQIYYVVGSSTIQLIDGTLTLNDGSFGGLCKAVELQAQLNQTNTLLTALIGTINGVPIDEPGNGSPSALQIALKSAIAGKSLGDYSEIINTAITHGV